MTAALNFFFKLSDSGLKKIISKKSTKNTVFDDLQLFPHILFVFFCSRQLTCDNCSFTFWEQNSLSHFRRFPNTSVVISMFHNISGCIQNQTVFYFCPAGPKFFGVCSGDCVSQHFRDKGGLADFH